MPWKEASPMDQRTQFIADYLRDLLSITELCAMYGVTRTVGVAIGYGTSRRDPRIIAAVG